jgi:hypothetical protein
VDPLLSPSQTPIVVHETSLHLSILLRLSLSSFSVMFNAVIKEHKIKQQQHKQHIGQQMMTQTVTLPLLSSRLHTLPLLSA